MLLALTGSYTERLAYSTFGAVLAAGPTVANPIVAGGIDIIFATY